MTAFSDKTCKNKLKLQLEISHLFDKLTFSTEHNRSIKKIIIKTYVHVIVQRDETYQREKLLFIRFTWDRNCKPQSMNMMENDDKGKSFFANFSFISSLEAIFSFLFIFSIQKNNIIRTYNVQLFLL